MANIPKKEIMRAKPADIAAVEEVFRPEFERVLLDPDFFRADNSGHSANGPTPSSMEGVPNGTASP